jgi:hypothetical protein
MSVKVVAAPRRARGVRVERACSACEAVFSYVPSDVREGVSQGDGRGYGVSQYRMVRCPCCRKANDLRSAEERRQADAAELAAQVYDNERY